MENRIDFENNKIREIADYWNGYAPEFDKDHDTEDLSLWKKELKRVINSNDCRRILDVGTGTGFLALMLAELGHQVIGVDIADEMMSIGKKKAMDRGLNIDFVRSVGEHLPFENGSFDAVVNCRVLWTLMDPAAAVREWARVLKPGGKVISFMRMMKVSKEEGHTFYGGKEKIDLPLRNGDESDYLKVYEDAGLTDSRAERLPDAMSSADMPGWTVFIGIKKSGRGE